VDDGSIALDLILPVNFKIRGAAKGPASG
jgi:hypothetical protein